MRAPKSITDQAAQNFLDTLQQTDPIAYSVIMASIDQQNLMGGMGADESKAEKDSGGSLWSAIGSGIQTLFTVGKDYYTDKKKADEQAVKAARDAQLALQKEQNAAAIKLAQAQTAAEQARLEQEMLQAELAKEKMAQLAEMKKGALYLGAGLLGLIGLKIAGVF